MNLSRILAIIVEIYDALKAYVLLKRKEELKNAAKESIENKDQRPIESEVGTSTDSHTQYDGMFIRKRKK